MGFGKRLKQVLGEKGITVAQLSRDTNIPKSTIYSMIQRDSEPSFEDLLVISSALNLDFEDFASIPDEDFSLSSMERAKERREKFAILFQNQDFDKLCDFMGLPTGSISPPDKDATIEALKLELQQERQRYSMSAKFLMKDYDKLNPEGKEEARKRIRELTLLEKYTK